MDSEIRFGTYEQETNTLVLGGEWDFAEKNALKRLTAKLHAPGKASIDLTHVRFMDSSVINEIFHTFNRLTAAGGALRLIVGDERIERLLQITQIDRVMEIVRAGAG